MPKQARMFQVDAFASSQFEGNPAAVLLLERWPGPGVMQSVAAENNLSETAFAVPEGQRYRIRWFTPTVEVDLCGHATLATAHVLFTHLGHSGSKVEFITQHKGILGVERQGDWLVLDFPADTPKEVSVPGHILQALGKEPAEAFRGASDFMVVYEDEDSVRGLAPDMEVLGTLGERGVIVTAPGRRVDFVSRFFAPGVGIPEDPVTGSAHTTLAPYWSATLGKESLIARQISARGGELRCTLSGDRVQIAGKAVTYLDGHIFLPGG